MREPSEWTEKDLLEMVQNQVTESIWLDYKACDALQNTDGKKREVAKDVSAFANSAGGVIVYGIREDGHLPTHLDVGLDPQQITKEWLEQVINSRIGPRIDGIRINQVQLSGTRVGKVAYVVYVPQSSRAPHMTEYRYYKRFNFESVPMEDYEVRDVARRFIQPQLRVDAKVDLSDLSQAQGSATIGAAARLYIVNDGVAPADFALITYYGPDICKPEGANQEGRTNVSVQGTTIRVMSFKLEWRGGTRLPIMAGPRYEVGVVRLQLERGSVTDQMIFWQVFASGTEPSKGVLRLLIGGSGILVQHSDTEWTLESPPIWRV